MRLRPGGVPEEVSPPQVSVRSRVHEYGGGGYWVEGDSLLYTALEDQALWWLDPGADPVRLTPPAPDGEVHRYADGRPVVASSTVVALRERHHGAGVDDEVVAVDRAGRTPPAAVVGGRDFFAAPRPSLDGRYLAWLAWDHPNMPWDGSELWVAELDVPGADGTVGAATTDACGTSGSLPVVREARQVAGGSGVSVGQPTWTPAGELWFVSDAFGWWQPWSWRPGETPRRLCAEEAEFHGPDWVLGQSTLDVRDDGRLVCRFRRRGRDRIGVVDPATGWLDELPQPCVTLSAVRCWGDEVVVLGATVAEPPALRVIGPDTGHGDGSRVLHRPVAPPLDPSWVSAPEEITFPTAGGIAAYMLLYRPRNPGWTGTAGTLPPLVVVCHGGPTGAAEAGFEPAIQMWTTRGVAVAVVDYRGSAGHGRRYRRLLDGAWGVADAEDCQAAATFLAGAGVVDGRRMVVKGSSAGGFTALRSLVPGGPFAAAVVSYGVTDLRALAADTHKFEARYLDGLVGPWPEAATVYEDRSPALHPERIGGAVLLLQGQDDPIVPPDQAQRMADALRARGVRCDHVVFPGEGHGFRLAQTLARCAELELAFVGEVLEFDARP